MRLERGSGLEGEIRGPQAEGVRDLGAAGSTETLSQQLMGSVRVLCGKSYVRFLF